MNQRSVYQHICLAFFLLDGFFSLLCAQNTLVFYARPAAISPFSLAGHAFVTWTATEDKSGPFVDKTYGFYPNKPSNCFRMWFKTKGKVVQGFEKNYADSKWVEDCVQVVSEVTFNYSLNQALEWHHSRYHLFGRNCLAFVDEVAENVGMKTPSTRRFYILPKSPKRYLRQLVKMNVDWKFERRVH